MNEKKPGVCTCHCHTCGSGFGHCGITRDGCGK